jgi:hypothetical protein
VSWSPWRTLRVKAYLDKSLKGPDHTALGTMPRAGFPSFDPIVWESKKLGVLASVQVINDLYLRLGYEWRKVQGVQAYLDRWTPDEYHGQTNTFHFGVNFGF